MMITTFRAMQPTNLSWKEVLLFAPHVAKGPPSSKFITNMSLSLYHAFVIELTYLQSVQSWGHVKHLHADDYCLVESCIPCPVYPYKCTKYEHDWSSPDLVLT
jgi:hypothetical protein